MSNKVWNIIKGAFIVVHAGVYVSDKTLLIIDKGNFKNNTETKLVVGN